MVRNRTSICFKVCAVFCATGIAIAVAETAAEPPANPLAAAKRDYEAFKASGVQGGQQGALNLRRSLPPLHTEADAQPMPSPIQRARRIESVRAQKSGAHSANWLIDGVINNAVPSNGRFGLTRVDDSADEQQDSLTGNASVEKANERRNLRIQKTGDTQYRSTDRSIQASNPLDNYMSKWMTPGDLELLSSQPDRFDPPASSQRLTSRETVASVQLTPVPTTRGIGFEVRGFSTGLKNDNPYIAELSPPVAAVPLFSAPSLPERVSTSPMPTVSMKSLGADPIAAPPVKPSLAETLKTEDETKFFKQLNRF